MSSGLENKASKAVLQLISCLEKDPNREGLKETPKLVSKSLLELTSGHKVSISELVKSSLLKTNKKQWIEVKKLSFYSLCEHHLLPFYGHVNISFLPNKNLIGFGALGRVVDAVSSRLQLQENMTALIAEELWKGIKPKKLEVTVKAKHFCMRMRGSKKTRSKVVTKICLP